MVRTFQSARVFPRLTVTDNVRLGAQHQRGERLGRAPWRWTWRDQDAQLHDRAAELVDWDYTPLGLDGCRSQPFDEGQEVGGVGGVCWVAVALLAGLPVRLGGRRVQCAAFVAPQTQPNPNQTLNPPK